MVHIEELRSKFFILFSLFLIVSLPACWFGSSKNMSEKKSGPILISVLDKKSHDDCHIKGSIWVPIENVQRYAQKNLDKNEEIIFYCNNYMCSSSGFARKRLISLGFENVFVYEGGVAEWLQKGYPTVGPANSGYLKREMKAPKKIEPYVLTAQQLKEKLEA